jgi:hypothetical protein
MSDVPFGRHVSELGDDEFEREEPEVVSTTSGLK